MTQPKESVKQQSTNGNTDVTEASVTLLPSTDDHGNDDNDDKNRTAPMDTGQASEGLPPGLPVDRGWAWVIMIAHFMVMYLVGSIIMAQSIFLLEYVSLFHVSVTFAAAPLGITIGSAGFGHILVANVLMPRMEGRTIVLCGGLMGSLFEAVLFLAPSMTFVCVAHVFIGMSHAMLTLPVITLTGSYFRARRSLALSIANTGLSVCVFVTPPLVQYLITSYGARGTFLLLAGMNMQTAVAACLMRPISAYSRKNPRKTDQGLPMRDLRKDVNKLSSSRAERVVSNDKKNQSFPDLTEATTNLLDETKVETTTESETCEPVQSVEESAEVPSSTDSFTVNKSGQNSTAANDDLHTDEVSQYTTTENQQAVASKDSSFLQRADSQFPSSDQQNHSVDDLSDDVLQLTEGVKKTQTSSIPEDEDGEEDLEQKTSCWQGFVKVLSDIFDVSLFRNRLFLLIVTFYPLGMTSSMIGIYFPSLGVSQGLSREDSALLLTVVGGVGLFSRLVVGFVADLNLVRKTRIVIICISVLGVFTQFTRYYTSFSLLAVFGVVQGVCGGVTHNLLAVVVIDLVGLRLLGKVLGMTYLINALWMAANFPFVGALVDVTQSFSMPFYYIGASQFLASFILLLEPLARRLETQRLKKLGHNVDSSGAPV